jgi:hypothetical protein
MWSKVTEPQLVPFVWPILRATVSRRKERPRTRSIRSLRGNHRNFRPVSSGAGEDSCCIHGATARSTFILCFAVRSQAHASDELRSWGHISSIILDSSTRMTSIPSCGGGSRCPITNTGSEAGLSPLSEARAAEASILRTDSDFMTSLGMYVIRGGGWSNNDERLLTIHYRNFTDPDHRTATVGFRCAIWSIPKARPCASCLTLHCVIAFDPVRPSS